MDAGGAKDEGAFLRTAKSCGPDTADAGVKLAEEFPQVTVAKEPGRRGARNKP
jgi:hypothetical protein